MSLELLIEYVNTRDITVRNVIIEKNIPLVKFVVSKMHNSLFAEFEFDDLVGYGMFGLIKAVENFDVSKNTKFSTFAYQKIYFGIIDEIRKVDHVPRTTRYKISRVQRDIQKLENECGYEIDRVRYAHERGLSAVDVSVMEGSYMLSADTILDYIYDQKGIDYDTILCGLTSRAQTLSHTDGEQYNDSGGGY